MILTLHNYDRVKLTNNTGRFLLIVTDYLPIFTTDFYLSIGGTTKKETDNFVTHIDINFAF